MLARRFHSISSLIAAPVMPSFQRTFTIRSAALEWARRVQLVRAEAVMRGWFFLGVAFFLMAVVSTLLQSREDEEMFIRLGGRDLRSLPM